MQRGLTIIIALFLLAFCAVVITIYVSIGSVIGETLAARGQEITQTPVSVGEVEYSANTGLTSIAGMTIKNPAGFKDLQAINFQAVELLIDPETLNTPVIHVKAVTIKSPEIIYDIQNDTDNLRTLRRQIEYSLKNNRPKAGDKRFYVENVVFNPGTLVVSSANLTGNKSTAALPEVKLPAIGTRNEGVTPERLVYELIVPLLRETTLAALNTDLPLDDQARNLLSGALDETEKAIELFKGILNQ
ncbi:hypothetical protein GUA87_16475 [Sneathiella sp. P13V-1]|uniref:hypothetical protein n=1 Tax=Sneathiella sp. P13V-1 TaxID=2697366 RepID=UPI00187B5260|nr:hypothetical protein [Sneathiella sp. P13V-1]MBE7638454.1 hypothetical protein [Sneathiella sp. P13V-1]